MRVRYYKIVSRETIYDIASKLIIKKFSILHHNNSKTYEHRFCKNYVHKVCLKGLNKKVRSYVKNKNKMIFIFR